MHTVLFLGGLALAVGIINTLILEGLRQGQKPAACIAKGAWVAVILLAVLILADSLTTGRNLIQTWQQAFQSNLRVSLEIYRQWHWSEAELQRAAHWATRLFSDAIYSWLALFGIGFVCINYLVLRRATPQLAGSQIPLGFSLWKAPAHLIWVLMAGLGLMIWGVRGFEVSLVIGLNGLILLGAFYLTAGWAIVSFYFRRRGLPYRIQFLLAVMMMVFPSLLIVVAGLGVLDTWWDLRQWVQPKLENRK